jgi:16S rRNA (guanine1207-N2)-methyltransferase
MSHYYHKEQTTPLNPFRISIKARGQKLELWSGNAVFSKDKLDSGTKLLIDTCILDLGWKVHDLGCGIGVVGIVAKLTEPTTTMLCSDVSEQAVELTRKNVAELKLDIEVRQSDGYESVPEIFDTVLFNPPYVAGRETIYRLIGEAYDHLKSGGFLQLVARHAKGGETLKKRLIEVFGNCDDSRRAAGYRVYVSRRD